ncbi:hypothetical protein, partial [Kaarinaea lacus]
KICDGLDGLNIRLSTEKNTQATEAVSDVSAGGSHLRLLVVKTDEELEIASQTLAVINNKS